jgi:hypothetical protein
MLSGRINIGPYLSIPLKFWGGRYIQRDFLAKHY